jgi:very-short-patch-repair endonuclease
LPDEYVLTDNGNKKIKDIKKGDLVKTHTGKLRLVYDTMLEYRDEEIFIIEIGNGQKLKITGEHPVMTVNGWKDARDLDINDSVLFFGTKRSIRYCKVCGNEIIQIGKKKNKLYCSQECMSKGMIKHSNIKCKKCGKKLEVGNYKNKTSLGADRKFCSQECYFSYKGKTSIELKLAELLSKIGIDYVEQFKVGKYIVDFYIPEKNILIEADGNYWHDKKEKIGKRQIRDLFLIKQGYNLYHLGQDTILSDKLENELIKICGAKCEITENKIYN